MKKSKFKIIENIDIDWNQFQYFDTIKCLIYPRSRNRYTIGIERPTSDSLPYTTLHHLNRLDIALKFRDEILTDIPKKSKQTTCFPSSLESNQKNSVR
jgi:hypothetical protein